MKLQYDPEARDYRAAKDLVVDIAQEHSQPCARAKACRLVLERVEKELAESMAEFLRITADILKAPIEEVRRIGLKEARRTWLAAAERDLEHQRQPVWYYSSHEPGHTMVSNFPPSQGETFIAGPVAIPEEQIEREGQEMPARLREAELTWDEVYIAGAINDVIRGDEEFRGSWLSVSTAFNNLRTTYWYRNTFRSESIQMIVAGDALPELNPPADATAAVPRKRENQAVPCIPFASTEKALKRIIERLCESEFLYWNTMENFRGSVLPHFSISGNVLSDGEKAILEKMNWRTTNYELIAFFEWLASSELMSESEVEAYPSMISNHFLRKGKEVKPRSISSTKSNATSEHPLEDAREKMNRIMKGLDLT